MYNKNTVEIFFDLFMYLEIWFNLLVFPLTMYYTNTSSISYQNIITGFKKRYLWVGNQYKEACQVKKLEASPDTLLGLQLCFCMSATHPADEMLQRILHSWSAAGLSTPQCFQ